MIVDFYFLKGKLFFIGSTVSPSSTESVLEGDEKLAIVTTVTLSQESANILLACNSPKLLHYFQNSFNYVTTDSAADL